jgi:hypothetical protein
VKADSLTPERFAQLKTLFQDALDRPAETRRDWLAAACGPDAELFRDVDALLGAHDTAGDFLEQPVQVDPEDVETLLPGTRLGDNYEIQGVLGRGGMGIVYLADDVRLGRRVALKSLPASVAASEELRERLRREARAAATVSHRAVATVYALEEIDGHLYIASEYVPGHTLSSEIANGPIPLERARTIASDVAMALVAAHDAGVIHRDLKPDNVLLPNDGVKVVDFGIAHIEGPESTRLTKAGAMLGTPAYMAPEQLLGGPIDRRADIYAFGVMLSEMLTGRHPLHGPSSAAPTVFATVIARCMQTDPTARFASARELVTALEDAGRQDSGRLKAAPTSEQAGPASEQAADAAASGVTGLSWGPPSLGAEAGSAKAAGGPNSSSRWWWEFHQAAAATFYAAVIYPAWLARQALGGQLGRAFFILTLAAAIVAVTLRLHLWFTSRSYPDQLKWARRRHARWLLVADWAFVLGVAAMGLLIGDSALGIALVAVAIGVAAAFLVIEPATTRAAFRNSEAGRT